MAANWPNCDPTYGEAGFFDWGDYHDYEFEPKRHFQVCFCKGTTYSISTLLKTGVKFYPQNPFRPRRGGETRAGVGLTSCILY